MEQCIEQSTNMVKIESNIYDGFNLMMLILTPPIVTHDLRDLYSTQNKRIQSAQHHTVFHTSLTIL